MNFTKHESAKDPFPFFGEKKKKKCEGPNRLRRNWAYCERKLPIGKKHWGQKQKLDLIRDQLETWSRRSRNASGPFPPTTTFLIFLWPVWTFKIQHNWLPMLFTFFLFVYSLALQSNFLFFLYFFITNLIFSYKKCNSHNLRRPLKSNPNKAKSLNGTLF